jgi:uncharacterized protein YjbJ (UPF0337 family)
VQASSGSVLAALDLQPKTDRRPTNHVEGMKMSWHRIEGTWSRFSGNLKRQWGKPSDDRAEAAAGKRDAAKITSAETSSVLQDKAEKPIKPTGAPPKD